jgi:heterodisulfide reductase subunit B
MTKLGYYPGCSLEATAVEFGRSTEALMHALGVELVEIEDWNCCGASSGHATDRDLGIALPARVLALAGEQGLNEVVVPCVGCFKMLKQAQYQLGKDEKRRKRIEGILGKTFPPDVRVIHIPEVLARPEIIEKIRSGVKHPPEGKRFACYYGCVGFPPEIMEVPDPENPQWMELAVEASGGKPIDWPGKVECCGVSMALTLTEIVVERVERLHRWARLARADYFVTACPICQANLDMRQPRTDGGPIPSIYITELIGSALGIEGASKWLGKHIIPVPGIAES